MATKVRIKNLKFVQGKFLKRVNEYAIDTKSMTQVKAILQGEMRRGLRSGVGYDDIELPPISKKSIKRRVRLATVNSTTKSYSPGESNLSFTGDLIQKIFVEFKGRGKFSFFGKGSHRPIKGLNGKVLKGSSTSISKIIQGQESRGYKIRGVFPKAKERIRSNFLAFLRRRKK